MFLLIFLYELLEILECTDGRGVLVRYCYLGNDLIFRQGILRFNDHDVLLTSGNLLSSLPK